MKSFRHMVRFAQGLETRVDSAWSSLTTGVGTADDNTSTYRPGVYALGRSTLGEMHYGDPIARRILEEIVDEALRANFIFSPGDRALSERYNELDSQYKVRAVVKAGLIAARRDGGAAILLVPKVSKARLADELAKPRAEGAEVARLVLVSAFDCVPSEYYIEPNNVDGLYSMPATYSVSASLADIHSRSAGVNDLHFVGEVHASHILRIEGEPAEASLTNGVNTVQGFGAPGGIAPSGWGLSVMVPAFARLRAYNVASSSLDSLFGSIVQTIYKIKNLAEQLEDSETESLLHRRFSLMERLRSVVNAVILDADGEEFDRKGTPLTDVASLWAIKMLEMAQAAKMPVSRLFGREPAGLNATGDLDLRTWYDQCAEYQMHHVAPIMLATLSALDPAFEAATLNFASLWQLSPAEKTSLYQSVAQADSIYYNMGIFSASDIALARAQPDGLLKDISLDDAELAALRVEEDAPTAAAGDMNTLQGTSAADEATVQDTAFNGSQIASMVAVVAQATEGLIPVSAAKAIISLSFPSINPATVAAMFVDIVPAPAPAAVAPPKDLDSV